MEGEPDSVDVDVWGFKKTSYTFSDLKVWLKKGDKGHEEKSKGKGKGKKRDLGKEKGKGKEKDLEEVRKHKKKSSKRAK